MPRRSKLLRAGHGQSIPHSPGFLEANPTGSPGFGTSAFPDAGAGSGGLSASDIQAIMAEAFAELGGGGGFAPPTFVSGAEAFYADLGLRKQEFGLAQGAQQAQKAQFAQNLIFLEKQLQQEGRLTQQQIDNTLLDIQNRFKISSQEMDIARSRLQLDRFTGRAGVRQEDTRLGLQARAQLESERGAQAERASNPRRILEAIFAQTGRPPTDEATRLQNVASTGTGALGRFAHGGTPTTTPTAPGPIQSEVPSPLGSAAEAAGLLPPGFLGQQGPTATATPGPPISLPGGGSGAFSDLDFSGVDDQRLMQQLSQARESNTPLVGPESGVPGPNSRLDSILNILNENNQAKSVKKPSRKVLEEMFDAFSGGLFDDDSPRKRAYKTIAAVNKIMKVEKIDRLAAVKRLQSVGSILSIFSKSRSGPGSSRQFENLSGASPSRGAELIQSAGQNLQSGDAAQLFEAIRNNPALISQRAEGGTADGEFVLVGEGKHDEGVKAGTAEFLFAPPGTVIAPVGKEPLTQAGASRAISKQLRRAATGAAIGIGGGIGGPSSLGTPLRTIPPSQPTQFLPTRSVSSAVPPTGPPFDEPVLSPDDPQFSFLTDPGKFDLHELTKGNIVSPDGKTIKGGGADGTEVPSATPGSTTPAEDNLLKIFEMSVAGQFRFDLEGGIQLIDVLRLTADLDPKLQKVALDEMAGRVPVGSFAEAAQKQVDELKARLFDEQQKSFTEVGLDAAAGQSRSSLFDPLGGSTFTDQQAEFLKSLNLRTKSNLSPSGQGVLDAVLSSNRVAPEDYDAFLQRSFAGFNPVGQGGASFGGLI